MLGHLDIIKAVAQHRPNSELGLAISNVELEITQDEFKELQEMNIPSKQLAMLSDCIWTPEPCEFDFYDDMEDYEHPHDSHEYDDEYTFRIKSFPTT